MSLDIREPTTSLSRSIHLKARLNHAQGPHVAKGRKKNHRNRREPCVSKESGVHYWLLDDDVALPCLP